MTIVHSKKQLNERNYIKISGGVPLKGTVSPDGAKNAALIQLAASSLVDDTWVTLDNVPNITDVKHTKAMLEECGLTVKSEGKRITVIGKASHSEFSDSYASKIRSSITFLGALLPRLGHVTLPLPGGDKIGNRPIDIHEDIMKAFQIESEIINGFVHAKAKELPLKGTDVYLRFPSVLATVNAILLAVQAEGKTTLMNVAKEPEIVDLTNLLIKMGAKISGVGTDKIVIVGVKSMTTAHHEIMPDRLETGALILSFVMTNGSGTVDKIIPEHNAPLIQILKSCGVELEVLADKVHIHKSYIKNGFKLETRPYPGFATDLQPIITALALKCPSMSTITDTVFTERFSHVHELRKMGAQIDRQGNTIRIDPFAVLSGATVEGTDIRTVVSLINAALSIEGESKIFGCNHLARGHCNFLNKLKELNADIELF